MRDILLTISANYLVLIPCLLLGIVFARKKAGWTFFWIGVIGQFACSYDSYSFLLRSAYAGVAIYAAGRTLVIAAVGAAIIGILRATGKKKEETSETE